MKNPNETIEFKPHPESRKSSGYLKFCTYDAWTSHLNIYYRDTSTGALDSEEGFFCISPAEALAVRDTFLKIYPLDQFPVKEKTVELKFRVPVKNASLLNDAAKALKAEKIND